MLRHHFACVGTHPCLAAVLSHFAYGAVYYIIGTRYGAVYYIIGTRPFTRLQQLGLEITSITQEVINLIVYLTSLIFAAAGIFLWVTYLNPEVQETGNCEPVNCLDYAMSLYFVVVTVRCAGLKVDG
ncbi:unnamed protein product [Closterium sp. NIES-53]